MKCLLFSAKNVVVFVIRAVAKILLLLFMRPLKKALGPGVGNSGVESA